MLSRGLKRAACDLECFRSRAKPVCTFFASELTRQAILTGSLYLFVDLQHFELPPTSINTTNNNQQGLSVIWYFLVFRLITLVPNEPYCTVLVPSNTRKKTNNPNNLLTVPPKTSTAMSLCVPAHARRKTMYRDFDCLCSSLAINCCQFSCCIPDIPAIEFPCTSLANTWMAQLIACRPEVKLRDLVIPGTHDSASYSLSAWTLFSAAGRTQNVSVYEQLLRGARYLDLRVAGASNTTASDVYIFHGCLKCAKLEVVLEDIKRFLQEHPQEFLFVEVVPEYGRLYTDEQRLYTLELVKDFFGDTIYDGLSYHNLMTKWTLAQVVTGQKKNMCVMVHPRMYKFEVNDKEYLEGTILSEFGFANSHRWQRSHWHNTRDIECLKEWNLEEVQKYGPQQNKILNNQVVMTPGVGGVLDVIKLIMGGNSLRPVSYAASIYKSEVLDVYFRTHAEEPWNMVMLDYIDLTPALVCFLISLNFPPTLKILKAAATIHFDDEDLQKPAQEGSIDVTDVVQSYVKRGRVLYLTDIQKDLKLDSERGTLTIAYQMEKNGMNEYSVLTVNFDPETEVLLSPFCRNEENSVHCCIQPKDHPDGGCVKKGCITKKDLGRAKGNNTILYFNTLKNDTCEFGIVH